MKSGVEKRKKETRLNEETGQFSASAKFPAKYGIFEFELELASMRESVCKGKTKREPPFLWEGTSPRLLGMKSWTRSLPHKQSWTIKTRLRFKDIRYK